MMRTFAMRVLGLILLSSLSACCVEPIGVGVVGAACYEATAIVHPYAYEYVRGGLHSPGSPSYYRAHGSHPPVATGHGPGHPVSHGTGHGGPSHGGSQGSHSGGSHGGHR